MAIGLNSFQLQQRQQALSAYLNRNPDISRAAEEYAASVGIDPSDNSPLNTYKGSIARQNFAATHYVAQGQFESRPGAEGLGVTDSGIVNTNLALVPANPIPYARDPITNVVRLVPNTGTFDLATPNLEGPGPESGPGAGGEDTSPDAVPNVATGIGSNVATDTVPNVATDTDTASYSLMSPRLDTIESDVGNIRTDVSSISDRIASNLSGQEEIQAGIGTAAVDDAGTRLQPPTLFGGQAALGAGQRGLMSDIGTAAVDEETGEFTQPTTLFGGQAGLMSGQTGLTSAIGNVGMAATSIGSDVDALTRQLTNFENLSGGERANLLSTLNTRSQELRNLANTYGMQTNRIAEQIAGGPIGANGLMQQQAVAPGSLPAILAAEERAQQQAQALPQNVSSLLTEAAGQGLTSNVLGPTTGVDPRTDPSP